MRWHKLTQVDNDDIVRHPTNSEAWKHLDKKFHLFFMDP